MAWIAAVLWIVGLLQPVLAEMEAFHIAFGKSKISVLSLVQGALSAAAGSGTFQTFTQIHVTVTEVA